MSEGVVTAVSAYAQPKTVPVSSSEKVRESPVMHPEQRNVYEKCVELTKVPLSMVDIETFPE